MILPDLKSVLKPRSRLLGLDVGSKTVGLALSDITHTVATPRETLRRGKRFKDDARLIADLCQTENVGGLIYGWPVNMDGSEGPRCQSTRAFARNFAVVLNLPYVFWDERWSTAAVERTLIEADSSRKRRAEVIDKVAAAYILQGALNGL